MKLKYLKIKDDVNLKDLEKFGFRYIYSDNCYEKIFGCYVDEILTINKVNRILSIFIDCEVFREYTSQETLCSIYDLILADFVEKVVEDE